MSEGREDVDITAFEGNIVISLSIAGAGGGTRTHTLSPAADFESATSTIPSHRRGPYVTSAFAAWHPRCDSNAWPFA